MDQRSPWLVVVASSLLLAIALWAMRASLTPVVATGGLVFLLWPYRRHAPARRVLYAALLLLGVWILAQARAIVYPALVALAIAFLLDPAVNRLQRHGWSRGLAALAVMLPLFALLVATGMLLAPVLIDQGRALIAGLPAIYGRFVAWIGPLIAQLPQSPDGNALPATLPDLLPHAQTLLRGVFSGVAQVGRGIGLVFQVFSFALLTPILTYYILADFPRLRETLRPHVPPAWAPKLVILGERLQTTVGAWLKGQLLVAAAVAVLVTSGYLIIGLPYALLLGFLTGFLNLVPVLGFWICALLALLAALLTPAPLSMLLKVALVLLVSQVLEQQVLSPRIVSRQLGVKPVVLLLVMLTLTAVLGVVGILLAAPTIGIARGVWEIWGPKAKETPQTVSPPVV
jgi:predicted PurR-regulated permease PerM